MSDKIRLRGKIWHYDITIDNIRYRGSCQTEDKNEAEKIASAIKTDIIRNKHDIPTKINYNDYNFNELWEMYIQSQVISERAIERKITARKHFVQFNNKSIGSITRTDIENYQLKRKLEIIAMPRNRNKREQEISFRTVNIETSILHNFFEFCINKELIDKNPAEKITQLNELSRLKTLSDTDIQKLINGATNKLTRDLITFLIYTGCRKGEALNLKWDDVDLQNDVIAIKGTKTRYDRYIPISKPLKELLSHIEKHQDCLYVFNRNGAKLTNFKRSFHTACRNAGIKDLRIHDLRHVFASTLTMNDVSLYKTGILLGHRTPNMTQRYAHLKPSSLKKEIEKAFGTKSPEELKREEYERALDIIREYEKNGGE
jgi:integrase